MKKAAPTGIGTAFTDGADLGGLDGPSARTLCHKLAINQGYSERITWKLDKLIMASEYHLP